MLLDGLPVQDAEYDDLLILGTNDAEVLAMPGVAYVAYLPSVSGNEQLDLTAENEVFVGRWFDPRVGVSLTPLQQLLQGGEVHSLHYPPYAVDEDWVYLATRLGLGPAGGRGEPGRGRDSSR